MGQQRQEVEVFVRVDAPAIVVRCARRVVQERHIGQRLVQHAQHHATVQPQGLAQRDQHCVVHPRHLGPVVQHRTAHVKVHRRPTVGAVERRLRTNRVIGAEFAVQLPGLVLVGAGTPFVGREIAQRHIAPVIGFLHPIVAVLAAGRIKHSLYGLAHARKRRRRHTAAPQYGKTGVAQGVVQGLGARSLGLRAGMRVEEAANVDGGE